ncbi:VOC family protein [Rhodohalobacter sp. SW132]|uniref:VOC family protein n=1 Tax=Rhodohalobacter sp. SW132 TaxID=2293433 RepID=UPI000E268E38|nr:VOC family protein [Rhodohalobacter sp. SW132]REL24000.1 VOC family protein [Rhodohalobacter sp. SW132]
MQKIVPHLWFDNQAKEASEFYVSVFGGNSNMTGRTTHHDTPSGDVDSVTFELLGHKFMAISAGPLFTPNPSISFFVQLESAEAVNRLWNELKENGEIIIPLDAYPWSKRYGWLQDRYGITWQISLGDKQDTGGQYITPCLMFTGNQYGKAEEALNLYTSLFPDSGVDGILRFGKDESPDKEGNVKHAQFKLENQTFMIMESAHDHPFSFNEAISLIVYCDDQQEIDHYWDILSAVPEAEQCGWIKDKFGVSWQIVPKIMDKMMSKGTKKQVDRVTQTFLPMKKLIISELEDAYDQTDR